MEAVLKIMAQKSACQDSDEDVDEDDDQVQVFNYRLYKLSFILFAFKLFTYSRRLYLLFKNNFFQQAKLELR